MYCAHCGSQIEQGINFCPKCGTKVASSHGSAEQTSFTSQEQFTDNTQPPPREHSEYSGQKSRLVAGLLQILLGGFGIGRFYLGYTGIAVAQLLVSIFTFGIGAIWPLIDGILILTGSVSVDANGVPLKD